MRRIRKIPGDGKVIDACFELKSVVKSMPPFWLTGKGAYFFYIIETSFLLHRKLRRDVHSRDVARATRRRRRILKSRILSCTL